MGFFCGFVSEFRALSDEELDAMLVPKEAYDDNALAVVARCTPADKQRLVRRLRLVKFHLKNVLFFLKKKKQKSHQSFKIICMCKKNIRLVELLLLLVMV